MPGSNGARKASKKFTASKGILNRAKKIVIFGPGGIGKTKLASLTRLVGMSPIFLDIGEGSENLDVSRVSGIDNWDDLRAVAQDKQLLAPHNVVVVDDITKAEEFSNKWVIGNVPHEKGKPIVGLEDYGWGKGFFHCYENMIKLLSDLDSLQREDKYIICIAHECTADVKNTTGDNWPQAQPRLHAPPNGKGSIRHRLLEWCDAMFYVGYDVSVGENGKGVGAGTRTIYTTEMPSHWGKNRVDNRPLPEAIPYENGSPELWKLFFGIN